MPRFDVVVVGAGLAGLSVAAALAPRRRILVVDGSAPGSEASAQNAGMLRRMGEDPYERSLAIRTHELLTSDPAFAEASRVVGAWLVFGRDPHHLNDAAAHLALAGVAHQWRDRPADDLPIMAGAPLRGGWWLPDERVVDAWAVVSVLLGRVRDAGGTVARAWIDALTPRAGGWEVRAGDQVFEASEVVLAAGAWAAALARRSGLERPLFPLRRSLVWTEPHEAARPGHPWCWVDDEGVYVRPEGGGWLVSGCDEAVDFPTGPGSRGSVDALPKALAMDKLARWFPPLAGLSVRSGWSGLRTFAPDRRPLLGADAEAPGLWWCAGLGGFGVSAGLGAGELVADWMEGRPGRVSPRGVSPTRPMLRRWLIRPDGDLSRAEAVDGALPEELGCTTR